MVSLTIMISDRFKHSLNLSNSILFFAQDDETSTSDSDKGLSSSFSFSNKDVYFIMYVGVKDSKQSFSWLAIVNFLLSSLFRNSAIRRIALKGFAPKGFAPKGFAPKGFAPRGIVNASA